ncbi:hypothetical protein C0992_001635 [Termitomyces sp. T32_za158]|nr:hypothetical protein C0992_001635 [Termitomyces sp. T32_za158]
MPPIRDDLLNCSLLPPAKSKGKDKTPLPPQTDPATWRESQIPPDELITSSQAKKWYNIERSAVLNEISWEPHQFLDPKSKMTRVLFVASHREIERKAWEKHGGPEGWDAHQTYRRALWRSKSPGAKSFPEPIMSKSSTTKAGGKLQLDTENTSDDMQTDTLSLINPDATNANPERLYESFISRFHGPWVWDKCNTALSLAGVSDNTIRESHLKNALATLPHYPMKQSVRGLTRKDFGRLVLNVLNRAPRKSGSGMEAIRSPYGGILYVWGVPYLTDLYKMLNEIIDKYGIVVWRKLRWRIYHTVSVSTV